MNWVAGLDGCRAGWISVFLETTTGEVRWERLERGADVLSHHLAPKAIGIDMPIGLDTRARPGGRPCDVAARKILGPKRAASVFSPPTRAALTCDDYPDANAANRASSGHNIGLSKQAFYLFPKIREIDAAMTPTLQDRVREVHPELSFAAMNGGPALVAGKKTPEGRDARLRLLHAHGLGRVEKAFDDYPRKEVQPDDILDAAAICWSAHRLLTGTATCVPETPTIDTRGLSMEICF